ncbi:MAG: hypothetical protein ACLUUO_00565 [Sellimonas intestinalis]
MRSLWRARFAVIGTGTGKALERKGILPDLIPDVYEARELGNTLAKKVTRGIWWRHFGQGKHQKSCFHRYVNRGRTVWIFLSTRRSLE